MIKKSWENWRHDSIICRNCVPSFEKQLWSKQANAFLCWNLSLPSSSSFLYLITAILSFITSLSSSQWAPPSLQKSLISISSSYHHNHKLHSFWIEKNPQGEADKHFLRLLTFCGWGAVEVRYCPNKEAIHRPLGGLWTLDADKNHLNVATIHKSTVNTRTDNRKDKKRIFLGVFGIFVIVFLLVRSSPR